MQQESAPRRTCRTEIEKEITSMYFVLKSNAWQRRNMEKTKFENLLTSNSQLRLARMATPMQIDDGTRDTQLKSRAYSNFREKRMQEKMKEAQRLRCKRWRNSGGREENDF